MMDKTTQSPLSLALEAFEATLPGQFKPDVKFYSLVGINRKRFGQLLRGDKQMFIEEAKKLSEVLQIPVTTLL